ncbi:MAG TPA: hypothetical protein VE843_06520 [Ktedonobacteraceae bacterium]|jgi:hypothetical protein|nr:hypothetical protein [Ktedonobacteraceae bacterium]
MASNSPQVTSKEMVRTRAYLTQPGISSLLSLLPLIGCAIKKCALAFGLKSGWDNDYGSLLLFLYLGVALILITLLPARR